MVRNFLFWSLLWALPLGAILFSGLTQPVPIRTEGLRVAIAEHMTHSGNWVVPQLWGDPILTKPPGFYWALSLSQILGGSHSLAVMRLVSVFALLGVAFAATWYGWIGEEKRFIGFCIFLTALSTTLASMGQVPSAEMDLPFSFWILWFWFAAINLGTKGLSDLPGRFVIRALGLGLLGGVSFLFKWTAPAFFLPVWLWLILFSPISQLRKVFGSIFCALGFSVLPSIWMGAVVSQVEWHSLWNAVMSEALPHLSPAHHTRSYPFLEWITFPVQIIVMGLPAAFPLVLPMWAKGLGAIKGIIQPWPFVLVGSLLIWTLIPGHRPRHALPIALGLAIVSVPYWRELLNGERSRIAFLAGLLLILGVAKGMHSFGSAKQRAQQNQWVEAANEMESCVGLETLGLDRIKEDGFVWLTRIPHVSRISNNNVPNWILCDQNQKDNWISQGFGVRSSVELSRNSMLFLLSKESKP